MEVSRYSDSPNCLAQSYVQRSVLTSKPDARERGAEVMAAAAATLNTHTPPHN